MKKTLAIFLSILLMFIISADARENSCNKGKCIRLDTSDFGGVLSSDDNTAQKAFDTIDDNSGGGELSDLTDVNTSTATAGNLLLGDGTDWESITMGGDCTITSAGVMSCTASGTEDNNLETKTEGITLGEIPIGTEADKSTYSTLSGDTTLGPTGIVTIQANAVQVGNVDFINTATATAGNIWIADGTDFESITMSGDVTINSAGVTSLTDTYLNVDQTTPQTIINGFPVYESSHAAFSDEHQLVDKEYVDKAVTAINTVFYMTDTASGVSTYKLTQIDPDTAAEASVSGATLVNDEDIEAWISPVAGSPTLLVQGTYNLHIHADKTGGTETLRLYWELYERKTDTSEVLIETSENSDAITAVKGEVDIHLVITTDYTPDAGSRIVGKIVADVSGVGSAPSVDLFYRGATLSGWSVPSNTEVLKGNFVPYIGATRDTYLGTYNFSTDGDVGIGTTAPTSSLEVVGDTIDFGGATSLEIPNAADVSANTGEGMLSWDSDDDKLYVGDGAAVNELIQALALAGLTDVNTATATAANLLIADGTDWESIAVSGDATISSAGVASLAADSVTTDEISFINTATATAGNIWIADGTDFESITISGDVTLTSAGVASISTGVITDTKCLYWEDPVATDDFESIWSPNGFSATATKMWCESDGTVNFDFQIDDGAPADVNGTDLVCDSSTDDEDSLGGDTAIADGDRLDISVTSVAGSPTWCSACFTYTKD